MSDEFVLIAFYITVVSDKSMDVPMQQPTNIHPNKSLEKLTHRQPNPILKSRRNSGISNILYIF